VGTGEVPRCDQLRRRSFSIGAGRRERVGVYTGETVVAGSPEFYLQREGGMADSVYRVTEVVGVSSESWEAAARVAVETAGKSVRDLRVAEVLRQDLTIENGSVVAYRVRLGISFKYESGD
jgi:dodecin